MSISGGSGGVYVDFQGLAQLKADAGRQSPEALGQVAEQFEAVFLQMMLKSMRQASLGEGLFDNDQSRLYQEMFDQQIALDMAKKRQAGIADAMERQLRRDVGESPQGATAGGDLNVDRLRLRVPAFIESRQAAAAAVDGASAKPESEAAEAAASPAPAEAFDSAEAFVTRLWPLAQKYGRALGVEPRLLLAQAALETGWGKSVSRDERGVSSHNLFNIKADERWDGARVRVVTLEFEDGMPRRQFATFRAYPTYEASFADYVDFVRSSPRYRQALEQGHDSRGYIESLQAAGYATDPHYANKVMDILQRDSFDQHLSGLTDRGDEPLT